MSVSVSHMYSANPCSIYDTLDPIATRPRGVKGCSAPYKWILGPTPNCELFIIIFKLFDQFVLINYLFFNNVVHCFVK